MQIYMFSMWNTNAQFKSNIQFVDWPITCLFLEWPGIIDNKIDDGIDWKENNHFTNSRKQFSWFDWWNIRYYV